MAHATEPLSYRRPKPPPRHPRRLWLLPLIAVVVLAVLVAAALVRAETKTTPYLVVHRVVPKTVVGPVKVLLPVIVSEPPPRTCKRPTPDMLPA